MVYLLGTTRGGAVGCTPLCCGTELILGPVKQLRTQNRKCLIAIATRIQKLNTWKYYENAITVYET